MADVLGGTVERYQELSKVPWTGRLVAAGRTERITRASTIPGRTLEAGMLPAVRAKPASFPY